MTCAVLEELIQRSLDAPLTTAERARLDAHLPACPDCRHAWEDYRRLGQVATTWAHRPSAAETDPALFAQQVLARVAARPQAARVWPRVAAFGLALAALLALSLCVSPLLPWPVGWHPAAGLPDPATGLAGLFQGLWATTDRALAACRWAALLLLPALAMNALLCLWARQPGRRTA